VGCRGLPLNPSPLKLVEYLDEQREAEKTSYNFCRRRRRLKGETPAMRQGLTDHVCPVAEVSGYRGTAPG